MTADMDRRPHNWGYLEDRISGFGGQLVEETSGWALEFLAAGEGHT